MTGFFIIFVPFFAHPLSAMTEATAKNPLPKIQVIQTFLKN